MNNNSRTTFRALFAAAAVISISACDLSDGPVEEAGEKVDEAVEKSMELGDLQPTVETGVRELDKALDQSAAELEEAADAAVDAGSKLESTIEGPPD